MRGIHDDATTGIEGMTAYTADGKGVEEIFGCSIKFDKEIDISKVTGDIVIKDSKPIEFTV